MSIKISDRDLAVVCISGVSIIAWCPQGENGLHCKSVFPTGWDASPSQGYSSSIMIASDYPFIHLGEERQCGIKLLV